MTSGTLYAPGITFTSETNLDDFSIELVLHEKLPVHKQRYDHLKRRIGSLCCIEDQETKLLWIYDVMPEPGLGYGCKQLVLFWLAQLHPNYKYFETQYAPEDYTKNGGLAYHIVNNYTDIPFGKRNAVYEGSLIVVSRTLPYFAKPVENIFHTKKLIDKRQPIPEWTTLNIHDPIQDDKLTELLTKAEKQFRKSFAKHLQGRYDIETYNKEVEMAIAKLVDEWNES